MIDIISGIGSFISTLYNLVYYIIVDVGILLSILFDPFLFLMVIFTISHFYTLLVSRTRKELIKNYFVFFSKFFTGAFNFVKAILPLAGSLFQSFAQLLGGMAGNSTAGTVITIVLVGILLAIGLFSFFDGLSFDTWWPF